MSTYKAVFSDIDGTLLTSEHIVSTATIEAIASLQDKNIPFVIISSRSASCIYPILEKHHFQCPIVAMLKSSQNLRIPLALFIPAGIISKR